MAFPAIRVVDWDKNNSNSLSRERRRGRTDLLFFFDWLRKKNVKFIHKVIVEDVALEPHSDEAIETCLQGFGIQSLDWSKPDLDPETIRNSSLDITDVCLYWSGNNSVLRAWGEPEGLRQLNGLKMISLSLDQVGDSRLLSAYLTHIF